MKKTFTPKSYFLLFSFFFFLNSSYAQTSITCPIPVTNCTDHSMDVVLDEENSCNLMITGNLNPNQSDCESDAGNNCFEFSFTASNPAITGFTFKVGTGSSCNGDVDEGYMTINGSECYDLGNSSSQTQGYIPFTNAGDVVTLTYCKKGSAKISLCSFCTCSIAATCSSMDATCGANGSATVAVSDANGAVAYAWEDADGNSVGSTATATGLAAGIYTVIVTDETGCQASCSVEVLLDLNCVGNQDPTLLCNGYFVEGPADPDLIPSNLEEGLVFTIDPSLMNTADLLEMGIVQAFDDCSLLSDMTLTYTNELSNDGKILTRTWTLIDGCSAQDICEQEITAASALPVEFIYFSGSCTGKSVILEWATASELNNKLFAVERSYGRAFERIGSVAGHGTTSETKRYTFEDKSPNRFEAYYRLRQEDFDGTFEYSDIYSLPECKPLQVQIFPNPVKDELNIVLLDFGGIEPSDIRIYDIFGRLASNAIITKNGSTGNHFSIDTNNMINGIYTLIISKSGSNKLIYKFVKESLK